MASLNIDGLGVALITPFKKNLNVDFHCLEAIVNRLLEKRVDYLVVLGTTAETPTLSAEEKRDIVDCVKTTTAGKVPLVIGMGGNNTMGLVREINSQNLDGFSAILSVAPFYNKPTQEGIFQHFKTIAENSPLPIILYNVPGRTGVNISPKTIKRLANVSEKINGVKEASGNLYQCKDIINELPKDFHLISGNDGDTAEIMKLGGKGVISVLANALPEEMKKIVDFSRSGEYEKARELIDELNPLIRHLFEEGNPAGVKAVLSLMGLSDNVLRLPLLPVSKSLEGKLSKDLTAFL